MSTISHTTPVRTRTPSSVLSPGRLPVTAATIDPIRVLRRHTWAIIGAIFVGGLLGTVSFLVLNEMYPLYKSEVVFEVQPGLQNPSDIGQADIARDDLVQRISQTETYFLKSREVLAKALANPVIRGTTWHRNFLTLSSSGTDTVNIEEAIDTLTDELKTTVVRTSNLFSLSWSTHVPSDVPKVLNAIEGAYMDFRRSRDLKTYDDNLAVYRNQLSETQRQLAALDQEMQHMIQSKGITTLLDTQHSSQAFKHRELTEKLADATTQLSNARTQFALVQDQIIGTVEPSSADILEAEQDGAIAALIQQIGFLKAELRRLSEQRVHETNMVKNMESRVRTMEAERDAKVDEIVRRNLEAKARMMSNDIERFRNMVEELEEELERNHALLIDLASEQSLYDSLETQRENLEARRQADLDLINQATLMRMRADAARVRTAQRAETPREKSFPKPVTIIPFSVLLTVGLVVGLIFLREIVDKRVKTASDLAILPGASVLGSLPDLSDEPTKAKEAELVVQKHPFSVLAESYRQVFTSLIPLMDRNGHQTLLLLGGLPGAGTTTVATNLAAAAAAIGKKVLVIDGNFRRPRLSEAFGVTPNGSGLGDLLGGDSKIEDSVQELSEGISILSAGTPAHRIFERMNNSSFDSILAELRGRYDLIIFDAPPAIVAGETMILANKLDAAVLVVRAHQEHRGLVARIIQRFNDTNCQLLGVVLNRPRGLAGGYLRKNYAAIAEYSANSPS